MTEMLAIINIATNMYYSVQADADFFFYKPRADAQYYICN